VSSLIEKDLSLTLDEKTNIDISETEIVGLYVMDMIGHNRDNDQDIFQIHPGKALNHCTLLTKLIWQI